LTGVAAIAARTVNVFSIFNLGRLDAMPASDLGIRRGGQPPYAFTDVALPKHAREQTELGDAIEALRRCISGTP
jgi:3-methyladenine DNA glycosylase/8-oxoguanine DNA glycosylase